MSSEFLGLDRVWYASYGSNLLAERFGYYLSGGSMGQQTVGHIGARDSTPATANRSWKARHELRFGGESRRWDGGGVAFVNAEPGSGECVVRLWLLTAAQFDDVAAQENQMRPGDLVVDHVELVLAHGPGLGSRGGGGQHEKGGQHAEPDTQYGKARLHGSAHLIWFETHQDATLFREPPRGPTYANPSSYPPSGGLSDPGGERSPSAREANPRSDARPEADPPIPAGRGVLVLLFDS